MDTLIAGPIRGGKGVFPTGPGFFLGPDRFSGPVKKEKKNLKLKFFEFTTFSIQNINTTDLQLKNFTFGAVNHEISGTNVVKWLEINFARCFIYCA